jgi:hypothetical protein
MALALALSATAPACSDAPIDVDEAAADTSSSAEFDEVAAAYALSDAPRDVALRAFRAFEAEHFEGESDVEVWDRDAEVSYARPFVGPGDVTPGVIGALSKLTGGAGHGREIGYYKVRCETCPGGYRFTLRLLGSTGGADPEGAVALVMHNHPGGTRELSTGTPEADCTLLCQGLESKQQTQTVLEFGYSDGLGRVEATDDLMSRPTNGSYEIYAIADACGC